MVTSTPSTSGCSSARQPERRTVVLLPALLGQPAGPAARHRSKAGHRASRLARGSLGGYRADTYLGEGPRYGPGQDRLLFWARRGPWRTARNHDGVRGQHRALARWSCGGRCSRSDLGDARCDPMPAHAGHEHQTERHGGSAQHHGGDGAVVRGLQDQHGNSDRLSGPRVVGSGACGSGAGPRWALGQDPGSGDDDDGAGGWHGGWPSP